MAGKGAGTTHTEHEFYIPTFNPAYLKLPRDKSTASEGGSKEAILPKGEVFRFGEPEFVGRFQVREDAQIAPKDLELCREIGDSKVSALGDKFRIPQAEHH